MRAPDLYRVLLWCYPAPFRREYGGEMLGAFHAELRDARRAGRAARAAIWARALRDLVPTAFREHRHVLMQDLRHALRVLRASPANFSLLNNVLLTTLPVREPQSLVLFTDPESSGVAAGSQSGERSLMT